VANLIVVEDFAAPAVVGRGGHAMWVVQILRGLARLGHRVVFVEFLGEEPTPRQRRWFTRVMARWWDLDDAALLVGPSWESVAGLTREDVAATAGVADALFTLSAHYQRDPWPIIDRVRPRILWEVDPGYTHLWAVGGQPAEVFGVHDVYLTVASAIGSPGCLVPNLGIDWVPTWQPVVLDLWKGSAAPGRTFSTVAGWRDYGWLEVGGVLFGPKEEEFRKFASLPALAGERLEIVTDLTISDPERQMLEAHGWIIGSPTMVDSPGRYRNHIWCSAGEFSCAKGGYVGTHSGWFSDRSACYLAAGRPVILQATGYEDSLPTGEGLFAVADVDAAADAIAAIRADYARHSTAARRIAESYFDSDKVLTAALRQVGLD
jgi:hypothetical protein